MAFPSEAVHWSKDEFGHQKLTNNVAYWFFYTGKSIEQADFQDITPKSLSIYIHV